MESVHNYPIYSVVQEPKHCPECGAEIGVRRFESGEFYWCEECQRALGANPLAAVHVIVRDGTNVLLLDEPIDDHEGFWSLPGGYPGWDEGPRAAATRELYEETGLEADPGALSLVTVYHATTSERAFHFATYTLDLADTTGELTPEADGFSIEWRDVTELSADLGRIREGDYDRIVMAFDEVIDT